MKHVIDLVGIGLGVDLLEELRLAELSMHSPAIGDVIQNPDPEIELLEGLGLGHQILDDPEELGRVGSEGHLELGVG